jgi:hypothetical protein
MTLTERETAMVQAITAAVVTALTGGVPVAPAAPPRRRRAPKTEPPKPSWSRTAAADYLTVVRTKGIYGPCPFCLGKPGVTRHVDRIIPHPIKADHEQIHFRGCFHTLSHRA